MEHLLAKRIKAFREKLEMTPEALAKASGLDVSLIEAIEAEHVYPALGVLVKLSRALGQRLGTFMDDQFRPDPLIVRKSERKEDMAHHKGETPAPYRYFPLGRGKTDRHMEPFFIEIDPHTVKEMSAHEGEEFIIVVSGEVELMYGKKSHLLQAGDSMYYNSIVPHYVGAAGEKKAEIYAMIFMPF
jgi:transcriptional regulator with XRE-family HTH domain